MVGCNSTINFSRSGKYVPACLYSLLISFTKGISLGNTNITLVPVPGKPYVYKAKIQISNDFQNTSIARSNSGPFAYIVRVSPLDNNVTSHSLLVCRFMNCVTVLTWNNVPYSIILALMLLT